MIKKSKNVLRDCELKVKKRDAKEKWIDILIKTYKLSDK